MNREDAKREILFAKREVMADSWIDKAFDMAIKALEQPERKKGKWNAYYHGVSEDPVFTYSCNQCGYSAPYGLYGGKYSQKKWAYCPNCGTDMRGKKE